MSTMLKKTYVAVYNGSPMKGCWLRFRKMIAHLAHQGHRVFVVVPFQLEDIVHENIYLLLLGDRNSGWWGLKKIAWALKAAQLARSLARQLDDAEYIAFDTHNGLPFFGARTPLFRSKALFVRGDTFFQAKYNEEPIYGLFMRAIDARVRRKSDVVVYNHLAACENYRLQATQQQAPAYLLENNSEVPPRCRVPHSDRQPFTVGYCGQLSPRKNVQLLLRAMEQLPAEQFQLVIKGNWDAYQWSREAFLRRPKNIVFRDWGNDVASFYQDIDLFVLPSYYDDFSNAALDAIAYGVPVLLSNTGGSPYMVREEPMLLFNLDLGLDDLLVKIRAIRDQYALACHRVGQLSPFYCFDWESRLNDILQGIAEQDPTQENGDWQMPALHFDLKAGMTLPHEETV